MPARSVPVGVSKFLIIDGQQRLTTISLLMCAVRDNLVAESQGPRSRIQQFYLTNLGSEGKEFFKLLPTQGDRDAYASLVRESGGAVPESQFRKAYDFFRRRLPETLTLLAILALIVCGFASTAAAQATATIAGTVKDVQGAIIAGAQINLTSETRGSTFPGVPDPRETSLLPTCPATPTRLA